MTKQDLLAVLEAFEDDVELKILIPAEEPYDIEKVSTDGQGVLFLVAAT